MDVITFPASPRAAWRSARTLEDLGELTARWLEGELDECPSYCGPPDPETTKLIPTLAAVNRAGFLTDQSQPGTPERTSWDGLPYWQRAAVQGFVADPWTRRRLFALADAPRAVEALRRQDGGASDYRPRRGALLVRGRDASPAPSALDVQPHVLEACGPGGVRGHAGDDHRPGLGPQRRAVADARRVRGEGDGQP